MTKKPNKKNPKQLMLSTKENTDIQSNKHTPDFEAENERTPSKKRRFAYYNSAKEKQLFKRLTIIVGILAIGVFITLYIISPFSKVGKIVVSGVKKSDGTAIVNSSELKIHEGLWQQYFKRNESSENIVKENPRIESATIELKGLNTMQIDITEYEIVAYVEKSNKTYEVLSNGKLVDQSKGEKQTNLPLLINFSEGDNLQEFIKTYGEIPSEIKEKVDTIESIATETNPFRIQINMKDGNKVIGLSTTIADKMAFYDKIVAEMEKTGVIDMEAGTTGVFSYPTDNENASETDDSKENE